MKKLTPVLLQILLCPAGVFGQQKTPIKPPPPLPVDMDCEKLKDGAEIPANSSVKVVRRGAIYYVCRPKADAFLTSLPNNATVAVVVRSTQTISCGDGSTNDCLREDFSTETKLRKFVDATDLWRYFDQAAPTRAELVLQFVANEQAGTSPEITLRVQDSNSGKWVFYESRSVTDLENDVNKLIDHFIAKCPRAPIRSAAEMVRRRQCAETAAQLTILNAAYDIQRKDYDYKNTHLLDAQMQECKLHWKDFVCLQHDSAMFVSNWNESGKELKRKMDLENEELKKMEQQISALTQSSCP
jgi:hypothetical protein